MRKAAIYVRVSTTQQKEQGTSLDSQVEACLKLAKEKGYEVNDDLIFKEDWTGATLDRPKLNSVRDLLKSKSIDALIVYSTDRLARNPIHIAIIAEQCDKGKQELIFVTEPLDNSPEGQLIMYVKGYAAAIEREKFRERSMRGKRMRAMQGRLPSGTGRKLYGYDYIPGSGIGEGVRYANENEAKWVRRMYKWFVEECLSVNGVTQRLRSLGVPTPAGSQFWIRQTVYRMLTNPAYIGKTYAFTHEYVEPKEKRDPDSKRKKTGRVLRPREAWIEIPNATPPIIPEELFEAARARLSRNKELSTRHAKRQYLLSGYVFCRYCGRRFQGTVRKWKDNKGIHYQRHYRCPKTIRIVSPEKCNNRTWDANKLEKLVWEKVEKVLSEPELVLAELHRKQESAHLDFLAKDLQMAEAKFANKEKQRKRIWRAFEITGDEGSFKRGIALLDKEIDSLKEETLNLKTMLMNKKQVELDAEGVKKACSLIKDNIEGLSFTEKRLALEAAQIKVWVDGESIDVEGAIPIVKGDFVNVSSRLERQHCI